MQPYVVLDLQNGVQNTELRIFFTFNARERLYFISVSSCVSIAYNIIRYQVIYEHFAQHLCISFIHIEHLHKTIHYYCHSYYIITLLNIVVLCGCVVRVCVQGFQCGVFCG